MKFSSYIQNLTVIFLSSPTFLLVRLVVVVVSCCCGWAMKLLLQKISLSYHFQQRKHLKSIERCKSQNVDVEESSVTLSHNLVRRN